MAYKSGDIDEELVNAKKAVSVLGGTIEEVKKFQLPGTDIDRSLVYIKKIKPTSGKFPRKRDFLLKNQLRKQYVYTI